MGIVGRAWVPFLVVVVCILQVQTQYIRLTCGADDFHCDNGKCIESSRRCDRVYDCPGQEDEIDCDCQPGEFRCTTYGDCIEERKRCDGVPQCSDGSDEVGCESICSPDQVTCNGGSVLCGQKCNNIPECDHGEDEENCSACAHRCDDKCILADQVCDNRQDCSDGSDEDQCQYCDRADDFRCGSGECIPYSLKCNGIPECADSSDENYCNQTMTTNNAQCLPEEFQCLSNSVCIDIRFLCDDRKDCIDGSDELNCPCPADSWQCRDGSCIATARYCDGNQDCSDNSDEIDCNWSTQRPYGTPSASPDLIPSTTANIYPDNGYPDNRYPNNGYPDGPSTNAPGSDDDDLGIEAWNIPSRYPDNSNNGQGGNNWDNSNNYPGAGRPFEAPGTDNGNTGNPPAWSSGGQGGSPRALKLMTYPSAQTVRYGGDVVFQCRDEGPQRANVKWRMIGRPIKEGSLDVRGRLEMFGVTAADSGVYICEAEDFRGQPGSQARVTLEVENAPMTHRPPFQACQPYEATCGNGQCIPRAGVCNGRVDCRDGSDEENCHHEGMCEPNQFKCSNRKCVLKTWICDSDDDCGDGSDEENCGLKEEGKCSPVEFRCQSQGQCIPKSFHCDGQSDCLDGSDEIGCLPVHVTLPPQPSNVRLNPGDTLILRSEAVGVPVPLISWRLNWGHVPAKCTYTSENGIGILTCPNMQPEDSGAYSSEAINNKGATFATPDAIVIVNKTDLCPRGYFNNEARSENECIRCFCFGKSTQCRSADLFTYNMPMPLGEGGTRLLGVRVSPNGNVTIDTQPITNQYYYQPLRNGATVTKFGDVSSRSNSHPYLTLPETYNGNQLKSYGGHIKYTLSPQTQIYGADNSAATIIIKGKFGNLFHMNTASGTREINIEARLTPEGWSKRPDGSVPASREDIMMTLDDIQMILLRADLYNAGVNITDFAMESAEHLNVGLGAASLVEECTCSKGYEGLSCEKCASGYTRTKVGPWLGDCKPEECPPGTYGDPSSGLPCKACPCPLTNRDNQFARTCSLGPSGDVICDCFPGYEGQHCEMCAPGYVGNPLLPGNTCEPKQVDHCNPDGTKTVIAQDQCVCKDNVQGTYCDQCKDDSFFLSRDFRLGCATCFCTGITQQCKSSNFRRKTISVQFNVPQIVDQVKIFNSAPQLSSGTYRYMAPTETSLVPALSLGEVYVNNIQSSSTSNIYYWSMPTSFAGDKVTAYGGYLRYVLKNMPSIDPRYRNTAADVQIISDNRLTFHYNGNFSASSDGILNASIQLLEDGWRRPDGGELSRPDFLLALADVKTILIKATYAPNSQLASPVSASIDIAAPDGNGPIAYHVEDCNCLPGYRGTSCEDCAPGYTRSSSGLYLEHCDRCECNDKSSMCDPETGVCYNCKDNTDGDHCERCKPGYEHDVYGNCVQQYSSTSVPCRCDPRGISGPCDADGNCLCKPNVEGDSCDLCRPGTFGLDSANSDGCSSCYCSGVTGDCHEGNHYTRVPIAAPVLGENYGGFTITDINAERVIKDNFIPLFEQSELVYTFQFTPNVELYWSLPVFPGNQILSYGGSLSLRQKFVSSSDSPSRSGTDVVLDGGDISIFWSNPNQFRSGNSFSYQVPLREENWFILNTATPATRSNFMNVLRNLKRVLVRATVADNIYQTTIADVSMDTAIQSYDTYLPVAKGIEICMCPEGYMGTSCETCKDGYYHDELGKCRKCSCNGHSCQLNNYRQVVCICRPPFTGPECTEIGPNNTGIESTPPPQPPPEATVSVAIVGPSIKIQEIGSSVNFTCQAQSIVTRVQLPITWSKRDGDLPLERSIIDEKHGYLVINNLQVSDSGIYICEANDGVSTGQESATLKVPGIQMTPPSVEIYPPFQERYEGDMVQLECRVKGNPMPTIGWQRLSNKPLPSSAENRGNLLIIHDARAEDSGEYRCTAFNNIGSKDRTAVITILPSSQPSPPNNPPTEFFTVSNTSPTVDEGQSINIVCTGSVGVPPGSIEWVRQDNALFLPNMRSENGVLYIDQAELDNQGVYLCRSTQSNVAPVASLISVRTNSRPDSNITVSTDMLRIPVGGSGTVNCQPVGRPLPIIKWTKHGGDLGPNTSPRGNALVINNAQESDGGYYLCQGTVRTEVIAEIYVYVQVERRDLPAVTLWPEGEQLLFIGAQFELHCLVTGGTPEPDITWHRNGGRPLSPSTEIIDSNRILKFNKVDVNDEGEYTCEARNIAGTQSASTVIKVGSPPEITITPSENINVAQGEPLEVDCRASGHPEPLVSISLNDRQLVQKQRGHATLRFPSVQAEDSNYYSCNAENVAGNITAQFAVYVNSDEPTPYPPERNRTRIIPEGSDIILECIGDSSNVRWSRADGNPLQSNAHQVDTRLIIANVTKSDSQVYVCFVYNPYNEVQDEKRESLTVVSLPRIELRPPVQMVQPGDSPSVECVVKGDDIIDVTWLRRGRDPSNRMEVRDNVLLFHQIQTDDAGEYECVVRSRYANSSAIAAVNVTKDPGHTRLSHNNEQWPSVGEEVRLACNATNSRIIWTKDGGSLPRSVSRMRDGSLYIRSASKSDSGRYVCNNQDENGRIVSTNYINLHVQDQQREPAQLVSIEKPNAPFRVGDSVSVLCRIRYQDVRTQWFRLGTNQYIPTYGDSAVLIVQNVTFADGGVYRCVGTDASGRTSYDDFNLEINKGNTNYYEHTAKLRDSVYLPCTYNLEAPVTIQWSREFSPLPSEKITNQQMLYLESVTEADAGTYICKVTNGRDTEEVRTRLIVKGVVPRFNGKSYISMPTLKDAFMQFEIEISFKPMDDNGLILYNSQYPSGEGDFIALQLTNGVPEFIMSTGTDPFTEVKYDRPLQLNTWHTIRLSRTDSKVTMDVDNRGPFIAESPVQWQVLELNQSLYVGGAPNFKDLPARLSQSYGFVGCVSMLILGREDKNIMMDSYKRVGITECDTCIPNLCLNNGSCQEARNERGYTCLCASGFAGVNCDRTGPACRPGLCGPGKCTDTKTGYKCSCPVTNTGKNCEVTQSIEYPAFTGSAYLAIKPRRFSRSQKMSMNLKAATPVTDGIIMYCAEHAKGYGGFISLAVHDGRLEYRYDLGQGIKPIVLVSDRLLSANEWTSVHISRIGSLVSLKINSVDSYEERLPSPYNQRNLALETPIFVGGIDDSITLNNNTGVTGGFNGCIKDFTLDGQDVDIINQTIQSANVQECVNSADDRGDIPEAENIVCQCRNGGVCVSGDSTSCSCPYGYTGQLCEYPVSSSIREGRSSDPCALRPCRNGGTCRPDRTSKMNHTCDCPLGYAGVYCQMRLELIQSVGFNGNGYMELPASLINYSQLDIEPAVIALAIHTTSDGVLMYQKEAQSPPGYGDYILLRIERGIVMFEWDLGGGKSTVSVREVYVNDGERHQIIAKVLMDGQVTLSVDNIQNSGTSVGISNNMNADSNIYLGGIPDNINQLAYPGFVGCIEQFELMNSHRGLNLGQHAVAGRNTQRCKDRYPYRSL